MGTFRFKGAGRTLLSTERKFGPAMSGRLGRERSHGGFSGDLVTRRRPMERAAPAGVILA